jgi:hypothetical protein
LGEVDNLGDLISYGYNFYNVVKKNWIEKNRNKVFII